MADPTLAGNGHTSTVPADVARFLGTLFDRRDRVLLRPIESWTEEGKRRDRLLYGLVQYVVARYLAQCGGKWAMLAQRAEREMANLYFGVCPRLGKDGKYDLAWQIRTVRVLWADLDNCTVEEALRRCEAAGLPRPTAIVRSGHGTHLYWLLAEPYLIDDADRPPPVQTEFLEQGEGKKKIPWKYVELPGIGRIDQCLRDPHSRAPTRRPNPLFPREMSPKAQRVQDVLAGIASRIGGDHTQDLSRLLRLPGTLNRKDERNGRKPVPCEVEECEPGRRYPFADFERFAEASPERQRREAAAKIRMPKRNFTPGRRNRLGELLNACAVADDRSRADWRLICWAIETGLPRDEVRREVETTGKFAEQGERYFNLTWEKAERHTRLKVYDRITGKNGGRTGGGPPPRNAPGSPPPVDEDGADEAADPERPTILITTEEWCVNDQAIAALAREPSVYQRGHALATVLRESAEARRIRRSVGSPRIVPVPPPRLREILTCVAAWAVQTESEDGEPSVRPAHPPDWSVSAVAARGIWPGIRHLEAVVEVPTLRPDGTILDCPGWDQATGLLFEPAGEFLPVPATPSLSDAHAAADLMLGLVSDFPFAGRAHRAAWLAAALTPLARFAICGPCPLFLFEANTPGSGKSMLCDLVALIATGREMTRTTYPESDEEMRKRVTSIALAGDRLVMLDNIDGPLGGAALDAVLTASTWRDRILGRSEMTAELPLHTIWFATGNNVVLRGDLHRRVVPCRLEAAEERPEEREGFAIPCLTDHVAQTRAALVRAALTILRAHALVGRPRPHRLPPLGGYEGWAAVVRSAVAWVLDEDPCATRHEAQVADGGAEQLAELIDGWAELPQGDAGVTVAEVVRLLVQNHSQYKTLRDALMAWSRGSDLPSIRIIGNRLRAVRGRVVNGRAICASPGRGGAQRWYVRTPTRRSSGESGESGDSVFRLDLGP